MKFWRIILAVYLLLCGLYWLVPRASFPAQGIVTGIIAIVAAVILLTDR